MPFLPSIHTSSDGVGSTSGTIVSLLTIALERARRLAFTSESTPDKVDLAFTGNSRIPVSEVVDISTPRRTKRSSGRRKKFSGVLIEKLDRSDKSVPQIVTDSIPIVHDRLPDPQMWKKLKLDQEADIQEIIDISRNPSQTTVGEKFITTEKDVLQHRTVHNLSKRSISSSLEGITRRNQLYCRNGYHLEILPGGKVKGTHEDHSRYGILEFVAIRAGVVTIRGVETGRYLSMDSKGQLYGSAILNKNSFFRENFEENYYNTYSSIRHRNHSKSRPCYVAITQQGHARPGCRSKRSQRFTHFLPRPVESSKVRWQYEGEYY